MSQAERRMARMAEMSKCPQPSGSHIAPVPSTACAGEKWSGLYNGDSDIWCPDAYQHPAKMSPSLCFKIIEHLRELGLLQKGDVILDPMCGIGTTLLSGAIRGFKTVGIELEDKFLKLAWENVLTLEKKLGRKLEIFIIQGDARHL